MTTGRTFETGRVLGMILRGVLLGLLLSAAVIGAGGYDADTKVFRYEGF